MTDAIKTLETLTDTAIDSAIGYERASEGAKAPELKRILREQGQKRRALVNDLNGEITRLGGSTRTDGSTAGNAHQIWTKIATAFSDADEAAAERVEEGEDYIEKKFREALDRGGFDSETHQLLTRAHGEIAEGERLTDRLADQYD